MTARWELLLRRPWRRIRMKKSIRATHDMATAENQGERCTLMSNRVWRRERGSAHVYCVCIMFHPLNDTDFSKNIRSNTKYSLLTHDLGALSHLFFPPSAWPLKSLCSNAGMLMYNRCVVVHSSSFTLFWNQWFYMMTNFRRVTRDGFSSHFVFWLVDNSPKLIQGAPPAIYFLRVNINIYIYTIHVQI